MKKRVSDVKGKKNPNSTRITEADTKPKPKSKGNFTKSYTMGQNVLHDRKAYNAGDKIELEKVGKDLFEALYKFRK